MNPQRSDMTSAAMPATIVTIRVEQGEAGLFYATSPELKGLLVAEHTQEALIQSIPTAIRSLYEACGVSVMVTAAGGGNDYSHPWIAMPLKLAEDALAEAGSRNS